MTQERINLLMKTLLIISATAIILGAIFQLQHWPNGNIIFWCGIWSNIILSYLEINRLRAIIAKSASSDHPIELSE